jgi:hypothetical protein
VIGLSTSIVWSGIGDDHKINADEMATTTLSGTVAIIGTVNSNHAITGNAIVIWQTCIYKVKCWVIWFDCVNRCCCC